ncbi:MAG: flippase [Planctomycetaceae bacterium]|nr:flippase [Planctomycetaceae bacterium]
MKDSKRHRRNSTKSLAIRGVLFNWLGRGCSFAITFFLTPYLVHTLGDERYGLWSIVMSLTSYYGMADMGLNGAGTKYIAQYHALDDRESMNKVIVTSLIAYTCLAGLVMIVCGAMALAFPYLFEVTAVSTTTIRAIVLLTGGTIVLRLSGQVFTATLTALQRHDLANSAAVSQQLFQALAVVAVVYNGGGLLGMAWATLGAAAIGRAIRIFVARRLLPGVELSLKYFDRPTLNQLFHFSLMTSATRIARRMAERLGTILVGAFVGPAAVTVYDIAERLTNKTGELGQAINPVIDPLASRLDAKGDRSAIVKMVTLSTRLMLSIGLYVFMMLVIIGDQFIALWIGPEHAERTYPVLCVLAAAHLARMAGNPLRSTLRGSGRLSVLMRVSLIEVALTLVPAPLLVWQYGPMGMAITVLLSQVITGFFLLPYATCCTFDCPLRRYFQDAWIPALAVASITLATALSINHYVTPTRMLHVLAEFAVAGIVTAVAAFFICLDGEHRRDVLHAVSARWQSRGKSAASLLEPSVPLKP